MNLRLPIPPERWSSAFGNQLLQVLQRAFGSVVSKDEEAPRVILRSPGGILYDVTVSDAGALVVTQTEKTRA